ncbi:MAG TPA: hypothetical protein VJG65_01710 [Patescibacteria group bacterium]|nr:hypothetical protein [Patescibacteria group bacterium]
MAQDTTTYWYVEPRDEFTNRVISNRLAENNLAGEDRQSICLLDEKEMPHSVWQVDYAFIAELSRSARSMTIDFRVYNRRGNRGPIRYWRFSGKKKRSVLVFR